MSEDRKEAPRRGPGGPPGGPGMAVEKPKNFKGTIKKLLSYISRYKVSFIVIFAFAILSTIFSIVGPSILGEATTEIFNGLVNKVSGNGGINFDKIAEILLLLLGLYLLSAAFMYVQSFMTSGISQKLSYRMRKEMIEKVNRMPMGYFDTRTHGEVLSRITNDVDTVSQNLGQSLTQLITSVCSLVGILVMMIRINLLMTGVTLLILPITLGLILGVVKKSQKFFKQQQEYLGHVNGQVEEIYGGHTVVKAFNGEERAIDEFSKANDTLYQSAWKSQFLSGMIMPIMNFVGNIGYVAVSILGGWLAIQGSITVGNIQAFIQYVRSFNQPISQLTQISNMIQSTVAAAERVFEFLDEAEDEQTVENAVSPKGLKGNVSFNHVRFGYDPEKIIIKDFSSEIKDGQKVAIVGPTGAGKTTMVKLIMRFYDINGGSILVDGHDVRNFNRSELRTLFGMVLQDTWLFNGTIMENIRYGRLDATDEEVIAAAKSAHVHHFVKTLPDGYNMMLNEEVSNISQGQKQLLTIARAILANPEILILDEATSSVDTRTEERIQRGMNNLMRGRTSFVIAHRLSTIKDSDLILVMNNGDIVEQGTHDELIAKNGFYASLYNSQFESTDAAV